MPTFRMQQFATSSKNNSEKQSAPANFLFFPYYVRVCILDISRYIGLPQFKPATVEQILFLRLNVKKK